MRRVKGWGLARGCALPSWGSGACPQKKNQFCAKNYAILSKFWYFFPLLQHKNFQHIRESGGLSPSPKSGGPIPLSPWSDAYGCDSISSSLLSIFVKPAYLLQITPGYIGRVPEGLSQRPKNLVVLCWSEMCTGRMSAWQFNSTPCHGMSGEVDTPSGKQNYFVAYTHI